MAQNAEEEQEEEDSKKAVKVKPSIDCPHLSSL
jgi:hypothetical protein